MGKDFKKMFEKASELNNMIGDGTSLWETGFIATYALFAKRKNDDLPLVICVERGRELMEEMLEKKLVEDRSEVIRGVVIDRMRSGEEEISDDEVNSRPLYRYVDHILSKAKIDGKIDGNHVISMACGIAGNDGLEYEIRVVMEPRRERWLGTDGEVDFLTVRE